MHLSMDIMRNLHAEIGIYSGIYSGIIGIVSTILNLRINIFLWRNTINYGIPILFLHALFVSNLSDHFVKDAVFVWQQKEI
jgi:hypothetical protein